MNDVLLAQEKWLDESKGVYLHEELKCAVLLDKILLTKEKLFIGLGIEDLLFWRTTVYWPEALNFTAMRNYILLKWVNTFYLLEQDFIS